MSASPGLDALGRAVSFTVDATAGNLTHGSGRRGERAVLCAWIENRAASGALGVEECTRLAAVLEAAARTRTPVVLYIDSAGAKVSEGLAALGAFRRLFRAGLHAVLAGVPIAAVIGGNCFGGASMLAHLAPRRLLLPSVRMAMSGPAIIAAAEKMPRAEDSVAQTIGARARAATDPHNQLWSDDLDCGQWLDAAFVAQTVQGLREHHAELGERLDVSRGTAAVVWREEALDRVYASYDARIEDGVVHGRGEGATGAERIVGLVSETPSGAGMTWRLAGHVWQALDERPAAIRVLLDCAAHSGRLADERVILSDYIVDASRALAAAAGAGSRIELTVLGAAGGGIYVALAAAAAIVSVGPHAAIRVLPSAAMEAILGAGNAVDDAPSYRAAGVAERRI